MAERIGTRGGAIRPNKVPLQISAGPVSTPSAGSGASTAWGMLARGADQLATVAHSRYDAQVGAKAHEAGIMDAIMGRVRTLDRSTTRGGAYMDAALGTSKLMAETNALVAMSEFYRDNPNDPAALQASINDYAEGAVGAIAGVDPGTAVELRARIVTQSIPMINGAVANREQETARIKKEQLKRAEGQEEVVITQLGDNIFTGDAQSQQAVWAGIIDADARVQTFQSEEAADGYLLSRLTNGHDASHIVNMQPELKTRLAAMLEGAPEEMRAGLGIFSGYRSVERQAQLFAQSDRSGRMVARPGHSQHNHGNAADLAWNGKSLKDAPEDVQDWVHDHAADYGLKFPMAYEPWHIETQETRGGEAFTGTVAQSGDLLSARRQERNDAVFSRGFMSYFRAQTDKAQTYLDFMNGKIELPTTMPDGRELIVNVRSVLSEKARGALEADLRAQIHFETGLRDDAEQDSKAEATKRSDETRAGYMTGVLANGVEMTIAGKKVRAVKPTEEQLLGALNSGDLDPGDYEDLLTAIRSPRPATTDEDMKRAAFEMISRGEDPESFILENLSRFTVDDAKQMVDYYGTRSNTTGTLDATQKFFIDQLEATFAQGMGAMDRFDTTKQERRVASVIEARARMLEGEDARAVFEDISQRAKFDVGGMKAAMADMSSPPFPRPRFSVPDPLDGNKIDFLASDDALEAAFANNGISDTDYVRQKRLLLQWADMQDKAAAAAGAP